MLNPCSPPRGLFKGTNFMTPNVLAYYKIAGGRYAELSEGRGMLNQPIFGVTVEPDTEKPRKSQLFQSRGAAEAYIRKLEWADTGDTE
jgi:hypothetical protein